jgi:hypothetical protein
LDKAAEHIAIAEKLSPHNRYVVDLKCIIAIRTGDLSAADKSLAVLERIDRGGFYNHRKSTFEQARGSPSEALRFAEIAVEQLPQAPLEVLANLANCQIVVREERARRLI